MGQTSISPLTANQSMFRPPLQKGAIYNRALSGECYLLLILWEPACGPAALLIRALAGSLDAKANGVQRHGPV